MGERKLRASREARRQMAEARRERRRRHDARAHEAEVREGALRAALARPPESPADLVTRLLRGERDRCGVERLRSLLEPVAEGAPRLVDAATLAALKHVAGAAWVRLPSTWRPSGKSRDRLFRSLAEHVLARYPTPPLLWSAFFAGEDAAVLVPVVVHVASGGSLFRAVKSGLMPVPLTRGMCHELLARGADGSFLDAIRRVQVRAAGGDARLARAWVGTRAARRVHARGGEEFWQTIVSWLCANPMLPPAEVGPLVDYIDHRRIEAPGFSIKGRSVLAMLRAMREWHRGLSREREAARHVFVPSGFAAMDIDWTRRSAKGERIVEVWHFREVLDSRTLADEGRAMGHCVLSYAGYVARGECSIWTQTLEDGTGHWRRLTIEVRAAQRQIVQARGRFNRMPEPRDRLALDAWASRNRLEVAVR